MTEKWMLDQPPLEFGDRRVVLVDSISFGGDGLWGANGYYYRFSHSSPIPRGEELVVLEFVRICSCGCGHEYWYWIKEKEEE